MEKRMKSDIKSHKIHYNNWIPWFTTAEFDKKIEAWADGKLKKYNFSVIRKHTPDYPVLNTKKEHFVFVYGTLKAGKVNHDLINKASVKFIGKAFTVSKLYVMYEKAFPVVFKISEEKKSFFQTAHISGEIYKVPTELMPTLDMLESNGVMYQRRRENFILKNNQNDKDNRLIKAWIYLGVPTYFTENGRGKEYLLSRLITPRKDKERKYYVFSGTKDSSTVSTM